MRTRDSSSREAGRLAYAVSGVGLAGAISLVLFFVRGGAFGTLNDVCNAAMALLTAGLAGRLYTSDRARSLRLSRPALGAAWLGALVAVVGSVLVISRRTGFYLAGLYTTFGYGLIGVWLSHLLAVLAPAKRGPRRPDLFGRLTATVMVTGLAALPGIVRGIDSVESAPWWAQASMATGLGWFLLFPLWCLRLGGRLTRERAWQPVAAGQQPTP
jgi:hypothetical protein